MASLTTRRPHEGRRRDAERHPRSGPHPAWTRLSTTLLRLGHTVVSSAVLVLVVIVVMFFLLELTPGDPVQSLVGQVPVSDEYRARITEQYGLDRSLGERFFSYLGNVLTGNLGFSFANRQPVASIVFARLGNSLLITVPGILLASLGGILLGSVAARTRSAMMDKTLSYSAIAFFSLPSFWLGLLLIIVFSAGLDWLPAQGMNSFAREGVSLRYMILPVLTIALTEMALILRVMRSSAIEVLGNDYIDTARSKGLPNLAIMSRHVVPNAALPLVSIIGYTAGFALAGTVLVEKVFGWPGLGLLLYESIQQSENMVTMGALLIITIAVVVINIITEFVYGLLDPRIRAKQQRGASV